MTASPPALPSDSPDWITQELITKTLHTWQPYYFEPLTHDDAVAMLVNAGRLIREFRRETVRSFSTSQ